MTTKKSDITLGLLIFLLNFTLAVYEKWSATDLIWGLWISSLTLGYAYILITIFGMFIRGDQPALTGIRSRQSKTGQPVIGLNIFFLLIILFITGFSKITFFFFLVVLLSIVFALDAQTREKYGLNFLPDSRHFISRILINLPAALFMLAFFSFHFIFFHFVHSIFLSGFFPLLKTSPFDLNLNDMSGYFLHLIQFTISRFWIFIALSAFSRRELYVNAFKSGATQGMIVPYKNVARMHLTIFVVAFLSFAAPGDYVLYFIFIIYFLPIGPVLRLLKWSAVRAEVSGSPAD